MKKNLWVLVLMLPVVAFCQKKNVVLISGDEEYRSEEAMPMLARLLEDKHDFHCTVLYPLDPKTGEIDPNNQTNIPGFQQLMKADLVVMLIRFRELPDDQMKYFDDYLLSGKPVIALRTSTHGFHYTRNPSSRYAKYDYLSKIKDWENGFGKRILGETWIEHHGVHGSEGTRALVNGLSKHPVLNSVKDIWCPTDVYAVSSLPSNTEVLLFGQSTSGMTPESPVNLEKSVMPVAWTRTYDAGSGKKGKVFATTMGAAIDLKSEDLRRLIVNACYWAVDRKVPAMADVNLDKSYDPSMFGFNAFRKGQKPSR